MARQMGIPWLKLCGSKSRAHEMALAETFSEWGVGGAHPETISCCCIVPLQCGEQALADDTRHVSGRSVTERPCSVIFSPLAEVCTIMCRAPQCCPSTLSTRWRMRSAAPRMGEPCRMQLPHPLTTPNR